jgi:hypothetical protein
MSRENELVPGNSKFSCLVACSLPVLQHGLRLHNGHSVYPANFVWKRHDIAQSKDDRDSGRSPFILVLLLVTHSTSSL